MCGLLIVTQTNGLIFTDSAARILCIVVNYKLMSWIKVIDD